MFRSRFVLMGLAALFAIGVACSQHSSSPLSPSTGTSTTDANQASSADGSTLKVTAPSPTSPANGVKLTDAPPTLVASASTVKYGGTTPLQYRFQVFNAAGTMIEEAVVSATSYKITKNLDFNAKFTWRIRAESGGAFGPWSTTFAFTTPEGGYIRGNELYDPLYNGKTVGDAHDTTFIPGVGIQLNSIESYVQYQLQTTLTDGEFSVEITNMRNSNEQWKTKVMSMLQGDGINITDNPYRFTADRRNRDSGGTVRYTLRSRGVDAGEPNAGGTSWDATQTYLWEYIWRAGQSSLTVYNSVGGSVKKSVGAPYKAPYAPNPHLIRLGSVQGRAGSESLPGATFFNVWVSPNHRPILPNDK